MTQHEKRVRMYEAIEKHGNNLNTIFNTGIDPVTLCKKLHRLEVRANRLMCDECNTNADHTQTLEKIKGQVFKILKPTKEQQEAIFLNGDPRGYTLKIRDTYVKAQDLRIETDWGGYGLIAPDYSHLLD